MLENIKNLLRRKINKQQDSSSQLEDQGNEEKFNVLNFKNSNNNNKINNDSDDDNDNDCLNSLDSSDSNVTLNFVESTHADESKFNGIITSNTSPINNDTTKENNYNKNNNNNNNNNNNKNNGNIHSNEKSVNESSDYINKYSNYYEELPKNYKLLNQLGEGAFSKVYKAIDLNNNQIVAIKIIDKSNMNIQQINSILKEITIMSKLNHKNIVKLLSYKNNSTSKFCFLFLEYCNGGEIFNKIIEYTYFSEDLSRHIILQVCLSIKYLHDEVGVVHRDIKPENLLFEQIEFSKRSTSLQDSCKRKSDDSNKIDEGNFIHGKGAATIGVVKLADFGLSKILWDQNTNTPCGTVGYTAPEIVKDEYYSKKVDVWAIGCVLYTLLCGFPPFYDTDPKILAKKVSRGDYCFLSPWWDEISQQAKDLVSNLLTLDPSKRYNIDQLLMDPWMTKGYSTDEFNCIKDYIKKTNNSKYNSNTNNNYYNNSIGSHSFSSFPLPQTASPSLNATVVASNTSPHHIDKETNDHAVRERAASNSEPMIAQNLSKIENTLDAATGNSKLIKEIDPFNLIGKKADDAPPSITVDHDLFQQFNNLSNDDLTIYHQNLTNQLNNQFNGASTATKSNSSNNNNNHNNNNITTATTSNTYSEVINTTPHRNTISGILANSNNNIKNPTDLPTSPIMIQKLGLIATPRGEAIKMVFDTGNVIQRISSPMLSPVNTSNNNNNNAAEKYKILEDEEFSINGNIKQNSISPSNIDAALEEEEQDCHSGSSITDNNNNSSSNSKGNNNASVNKFKSRFGELKISKGTSNNKTQFAPATVEPIKEDEIANAIEVDESFGRRRKSSSVSFTIIPKIHQQNNRSHRNSSVTSNNSELNNVLSGSYTDSRVDLDSAISSANSVSEGKNGGANDDTTCNSGENNSTKTNSTVKIAREHHEEHPLHTRHSQHNGDSTNNNLLGVSGTFQNHSLLPKTPIDFVCKKLELLDCTKNHEHACNCRKPDDSFDDIEESDDEEDDDDEESDEDDDDSDEDDDSDLDSDDSILGNHPKIELREYVKAKNSSISSESSIPKTPFPIKTQNKNFTHHDGINDTSSDILISPLNNKIIMDDDNKRSSNNSTTQSSSKIRPSNQSISSTIYDEEIMNNQDSGNSNQSSEDFLDKMNRINDAFDLKMDTSKMLLRRKQIGSVGCGIKETSNTIDINNLTENRLINKK